MLIAQKKPKKHVSKANDEAINLVWVDKLFNDPYRCEKPRPFNPWVGASIPDISMNYRCPIRDDGYFSVANLGVLINRPEFILLPRYGYRNIIQELQETIHLIKKIRLKRKLKRKARRKNSIRRKQNSRRRSGGK